MPVPPCAQATDCYPLQPGGVLVIQGYVMGLATAHRFKHEVETNINVILLVIFMVSCIHFMKALLLWIFTDLLVKIENKTLLSIAVSSAGKVALQQLSTAWLAGSLMVCRAPPLLTTRASSADAGRVRDDVRIPGCPVGRCRHRLRLHWRPRRVLPRRRECRSAPVGQPSSRDNV
eukprot:COSAG05_NODE_10131_length_581_cov_1.543568_1_plen_174_part_01